jgi:ABC-type nitrate/sulfonate/bicarbonate transport system ATPase subunit
VAIPGEPLCEERPLARCPAPSQYIRASNRDRRDRVCDRANLIRLPTLASRVQRPASGSGGAITRGALVGREREVRVLRAFVDDPDRGGVAVVHGAAGIGKSALLDAAAGHARERGLAVLWTADV